MIRPNMTMFELIVDTMREGDYRPGWGWGGTGIGYGSHSHQTLPSVHAHAHAHAHTHTRTHAHTHTCLSLCMSDHAESVAGTVARQYKACCRSSTANSASKKPGKPSCRSSSPILSTFASMTTWCHPHCRRAAGLLLCGCICLTIHSLRSICWLLPVDAKSRCWHSRGRSTMHGVKLSTSRRSRSSTSRRARSRGTASRKKRYRPILPVHTSFGRRYCLVGGDSQTTVPARRHGAIP